jgi:hypothetical protein
MAEANVKRRGHGEDAIYFESARTAMSGPSRSATPPDGKRIRRKVSGRTRRSGTSSRRCTPSCMPGSDRRPGTRCAARWRTGCVRAWTADPSGPAGLYEGLLEPVLEIIGAWPLQGLTRAT